MGPVVSYSRDTVVGLLCRGPYMTCHLPGALYDLSLAVLVWTSCLCASTAFLDAIMLTLSNGAVDLQAGAPFTAAVELARGGQLTFSFFQHLAATRWGLGAVGGRRIGSSR